MPLKHSSNIKNQMAKLKLFAKNDVQRIVGVEAVKFFKDSFIQQGWTDVNTEPWKQRKTKDKGTKGNRKVLEKTGALMNSIQYEIRGNKIVVMSKDIPYAQIHNEGGVISTTQKVRSHTRRTRSGRSKVRAHTRQIEFTMPKRQFMGNSQELNKKIELIIAKRIKKILK